MVSTESAVSSAASAPRKSTLVSFPAGAVTGHSTVSAVLPTAAGRTGVMVAQTPFHPLDHSWPDQPGDTGTLVLGGQELRVVDCLTGAVAADGEQAGELLIGDQIPVRRGSEGWVWLAVHVVEGSVGGSVEGSVPGSVTGAALLGEPVELRVDAERRAALSAAHTGCHLLAFALNAVLAGRWRKEARGDSLGNPDFDGLAMQSSRIGPGQSTDVYRLGKSLRKKGFSTEGLAEELAEIQQRTDAVLAGWVSSAAPVRIEVPGPELTARRSWRCELPEGTAEVACGGTHLHGLGELIELSTRLELSEDGSELTAVTTAVRAVS
jgi:alanyl-tRNA synthetase